MDVTVDKIFWGIAVDERVEALEAFVATVFCIMNMPGRGMGNDHIDAAFPPELHPHVANHALHLPFGVLIGTPVVPSGSFEPRNVETLELHPSPMNVDAPIWRLLIVTDIVVSFDIVKGRSQPVCQKNEIFRRQIPTRKDEIDIGETVGIKGIVEHGLHTVGNS